MNLRMFSAIIIVLTVVLTGINANAQQLKLDTDLISTPSTLDGAQQLKLDEYANFWIQKSQYRKFKNLLTGTQTYGNL